MKVNTEMPTYVPPDTAPSLRPGDCVDDSVVLEGSLAETGVVLGPEGLTAEIFVYGDTPHSPPGVMSAEVYPLGRSVPGPREMLIKGGFYSLDSDAVILDFARTALTMGAESER